jgi:hypothetical protein
MMMPKNLKISEQKKLQMVGEVAAAEIGIQRREDIINNYASVEYDMGMKDAKSTGRDRNQIRRVTNQNEEELGGMILDFYKS